MTKGLWSLNLLCSAIRSGLISVAVLKIPTYFVEQENRSKRCFSNLESSVRCKITSIESDRSPDRAPLFVKVSGSMQKNDLETSPLWISMHISIASEDGSIPM